MIRQLFKLAWNRKRANFLITVEIAVAFLVLFGVVTGGLFFWQNYRAPLGFVYEDVWQVVIEFNQNADDNWTKEQVETVRRLVDAARELPEVEGVAAAQVGLYDSGSMYTGFDHDGVTHFSEFAQVTDDFAAVMGVELTRGRWFSREDDGANYLPVVVNERFARELFGDADPIGASVQINAEPGARPRRVVGVMTDFRRGGEYSAPANMFFERKRLDDSNDRPLRYLLVKMRPGTTRQTEERLIARLQGVAHDWSFQSAPLAETRESTLKLLTVPLVAAGLVAGFLMLMVALGLTGVVWQSVTRRRREIGLRRAVGASARDVYLQILGELVVVATLGLAVATLVVLQLPLLDLIGSLSTTAYLGSLAVSLGLMYLLTIVCGLYPSLLATRIHPAAVLHYE